MSVALSLGTLLAIGARSFSVVIGSNKLIGLTFWLAIVATLGILEVCSHLSRCSIPSASDLVARYLRHPVVRAAAIGVWLFAGYHLFCH